MTWIILRDPFDQPLRVDVVDGEVTAVSDEAPVELVFTAASARTTAERLLQAAELADSKTNEALKPKRPDGSA